MNLNAANISKSALNGLLFLLILLNFFAGIVGGAWLLITGNWELVVYGLVLDFIMPWGYTIAVLPTFLLMPLLIKSSEKKNVFFTTILGFISSFYTNAVIAYWAWYVFNQFAVDANGIFAVPLLLWAYSTVMAPLAYMASKEDDGVGTSLGLFIAQLGFVVVTIMWLFGGIGFVGIALGLLVILFSVFATAFAVHAMKQEETQAEYMNSIENN